MIKKYKKIIIASCVVSCAVLWGVTNSYAQGIAQGNAQGNVQEINPDHLSAGQRMISATGLTKPFDLILPEASKTLKEDIHQNNQGDEYRFDTIFDIVDEETLNLATRRGNLEKEAVRLITQTYTTEELNQISQFFLTTTGIRFFEVLPYALPYSLDELNEIANFLMTSSGKKMSRSMPHAFRYTSSEINEIQTFLDSDAGQKFHATMPAVFSELGQAGRIWGDGIKRDLARNVMAKANQFVATQQTQNVNDDIIQTNEADVIDNSGDKQ